MSITTKVHVFNKVPVAQCWERTRKAPLKARWVDIDRHEISKQMGSQTVQMIIQRRVVCRNSAN